MLNWQQFMRFPKEPRASIMAYPEPTPALKGEEAKEFLKRLKKFKLSAKQKEKYRGVRADYNAAAPKDDDEPAK